MRLYIDSSALIASVKKVSEPEHTHARALVNSCPSQNEMVTSSLSITEFVIALAKHTTLPANASERTLELLRERHELEIASHDDFIDAEKLVAFEHRDLLKKLDMPSADVHHIAAAYMMEAPLLVTTDQRHLLKEETVHRFEKLTRILSPADAVRFLKLGLA